MTQRYTKIGGDSWFRSDRCLRDFHPFSFKLFPMVGIVFEQKIILKRESFYLDSVKFIKL